MKPKSLIFLIIGMIAFSCQKDESLSVVSITSFSPTSGIVGTVVTISGTNFSTTAAQNVVKFGSVVATVTSATNTEIKTTVPAGVVSAPISVTVNGKTATSKDAFSLTPPPTITSFTPTHGPIGIDVVIAGTNFTTNLSMVTVKFNGATAVVKSTTETSITATVPADGGTGVISVSIGQQQVGSSTPFTLLPRPAITGVSTKRGFEGDRVVISGNGFSPTAANNKVTFGTIPVPLIISATSDKLVVAVPTGGIDGNIVVTSEGVASEPFASFDVLNEISISTLAGSTTAFGASDGTGSAATFWSPAGMVTDNSGNVLVCEPLNHTIRKITPQGVVTTLAGGTFGYADGVNNNAQFEGPVTIVKDVSGVFLWPMAFA